MGILELPGVHMHWADRWGLRKPRQPQVGQNELMAEGSAVTILEPSPIWIDELGEAWDSLDTKIEPEPEPQPWFTIRCGVCDHEVPFYIEANVADLNPFNVTVIATQCEQCASRWAAVLSPVRIMEADKLNLQEADIINGRTD